MSSLVGHILSIRFAKNPLHYPVIAHYRKDGMENYAIPLWNEASGRFIEYRQDSYFLVEGRAQFSSQAFPMSEQHKACARAYRLQQLLKKSSRRLQRAKAFNLAVGTTTAQKSMAGHWGNWPEAETVYVDESPYLADIQALHSKLDKLFRAEMALAGLTI